MNHIVNNLWLGSQHDADELVRHNPEQITAILNVRGPDAYQPPGRDQSADHPGKAYKWIPAPDTQRVSPEHVHEAVEWLQEQTRKHERILIHCMHGISRSPAFVAAFLVKSGICACLDDAKTLISAHRSVQPAAQLVFEPEKPVPMISPLTGLPNRQTFDGRKASPFTAIVNVDRMKVFNEYYGEIAGDVLLRRLGQILASVELDAYHDEGDQFLCRGDSRAELQAKLARARKMLGAPFEVYADGRMHTIEEMNFSFGIGASAEERETALREAKAQARNASPEWLRKIIEGGGLGQTW